MYITTYPDINVNIVGKDFPIARIYADILPLMLAANDMLASNDMLVSIDMLA